MEAVKGYHFHFAIYIKCQNLNEVQFFKKYTKNECLIDHHLQRNIFFKAYGSLKSGKTPTPINSRIKHVANQPIFKISSVQKFSILVLNLKIFSKILLNEALLIFGAILI